MTDTATSPTEPGSETGRPERSPRWVLDPNHSSIWFSGRQLAISTVRGRFRRFEVDLQIDGEDPRTARVHATIEAASLDTGMEQRDQHLRSADFLDAENHPAIEFQSDRVDPINAEELGMHGDLTIRDITRPVTLDVTFHGSGMGMAGERRVAFTARTKIDRTAWDLRWNVPVGESLLVGDELELVIDVSFAEQPEGAEAAA